MKLPIAVGLTVLLMQAPLPALGDDKTDSIAEASLAAAAGAILCWTTNAAAAALAAKPGEYARSGWLLGVRSGYALTLSEDDLESDLGVSGLSVDLDDSWHVGGIAGYRCHPRLTVQVQLEWLDSIEADVDMAGAEVASVEVEPLVITTNLKGHILTGRYQPYLLVGGGAMTTDVDIDDPTALGLPSGDQETDFVLRVGGGVDIYATKNVVVNVGVDYVRPLDNLDDLDYVSIGGGLEYRF